VIDYETQLAELIHCPLKIVGSQERLEPRIHDKLIFCLRLIIVGAAAKKQQDENGGRGGYDLPYPAF
jgi:hypothetical protein